MCDRRRRGREDPSPSPLYKTTAVIWSEFPGDGVELEHLAREATVGEAYCSCYRTVRVEKPDRDPAWDGTDFFAMEDWASVSRDASEGDDEKVTVEISLVIGVTDPAALQKYARERYASCWFEEWEPADLGEAVLEALVVSNENPSPDDYGIAILDSQAALQDRRSSSVHGEQD